MGPPPKGTIVFQGSYLPGDEGKAASASNARWEGQWRFESGSTSSLRTFSYARCDRHPACGGYHMTVEGLAPGARHLPEDAASVSPVFWGYSDDRSVPAERAAAADSVEGAGGAAADAAADAPALAALPAHAAALGGESECTWSGHFTVKGKGGENFHVNDLFTLRVSSGANAQAVPVIGYGSNYYGRFELRGTLCTVDGAHQLVCKRHYVVPERKPTKKKKPVASANADAQDSAPVRASKRQRVATKFDKDLGAASFSKPRPSHERASALAAADAAHDGGGDEPGSGATAVASGADGAGGDGGSVEGARSSTGSSRHARGRARPRKGAGDAGVAGGGADAASDGARAGIGKSRAGDTAAGASRGKVVWFDAHATDKGDTYEGEYMDGLRHGWGTCVLPNGRMYEGEWSEGVEHGFGIISGAKNEVLFEGEFCEGQFHGCGTYYFTPPRKGEPYEYFEGEWKDGMRHGHGVYTEADGTCYIGEWRGDGRCGRGRLACADGSWYEGEWQHDGRHGHGVLELRNGFRYEGNFKDDMMDGRGSCRYPDGSCYEGMWRAGKKDGRGTLKFVNGACYEGRFRDDKMDGTGTLTMARSCIMHSETDSADKWTALIPIGFQSDVQRMHLKAGFDQEGM